VSEPCIVCSGIELTAFHPGLLKCPQCGHAVADMRMSDKDLHALYRKEYFFGKEYSDYIADRTVLQENFRLRLRSLRPFLTPERHRRLLEIGSAYGFFLDIAREEFESVQGIDIAEDGVRYARESLGLNVIQGDLLEYDFGGQTFDVVCLWDTIEHLGSPHLYIEKAATLVQGGGLITVTTGDIGSINARLKGANWRLIHPPTHMHYFTKNSLERLLAHYGFDTVYNQYCGFYRSVDNVAYNLFVLRYQMPWLYKVMRRSGLCRVKFYSNLYDIVNVIARKR
jgi:2-polyprenyl-3-methyl-5-hydroxy-6-metoxy-1,4-benzoquinol methylase